MQAAIDGKNLAGGFAEAVGEQEVEGLGLVGGRDGHLGQGALGVEQGQLRAQLVVALVL